MLNGMRPFCLYVLPFSRSFFFIFIFFFFFVCLFLLLFIFSSFVFVFKGDVGVENGRRYVMLTESSQTGFDRIH